MAAALASDEVNLGFVVETERQVEEHLTGHMNGCRPPTAARHRRADARRRSASRCDGAGGRRTNLPFPVRADSAADVMRAVAYRV
jgi:ubiquinone biosynthesis monooxygenase Coq7